ncbi:tryptophan synthase subunit alpha [Streptomyces sp. NPDC048566]|uniref:tryptophan synthase subunit alpha n=1 Tax=Streptomyces sp. NPDC048566 TaxID=3365569 RepID=UPI003719A6EC
MKAPATTAPVVALPWWPAPEPVGAHLARTIEQARAQARSALAVYLPVGYPDQATGREALHLLAQSADVIELGIPHPGVLDGPTIQDASRTALAAGFRMRHLFEAARELSATSAAALVVTSYWQPVHAYGPARFAARAAAAGISGVLLPDLPLEESRDWLEAARAAGLAAIPLVSSRTTPERLARITAMATSMIYAPATDGITGNGPSISATLPHLISRLRSLTDLPIAAGIGISTPDQARAAARWADLVAVGSAVIRHMHAHPRAPVKAAAAAGQAFAAALRTPHSSTDHARHPIQEDHA